MISCSVESPLEIDGFVFITRISLSQHVIEHKIFIRFLNQIEHYRTHKKFCVRICSIAEHNQIQLNDCV